MIEYTTYSIICPLRLLLHKKYAGHFTVLKPIYYRNGNQVLWKWFYLDSFDKNQFYAHDKLHHVQELSGTKALQYYREFTTSAGNERTPNVLIPIELDPRVSPHILNDIDHPAR